MKKLFTFLVAVVISIATMTATDFNYLSFTGGTSDYTAASTVDASGNVYLVGSSYGTWGTPVNATGGVFIAKYNSTGNLVWNTYVGGTVYDSGNGIAVDASGNVFVSGSSVDSWGSNIKKPFAGEYVPNVFVVKLNSDGVYQWNSFIAGESYQVAGGLCVDNSGNAYVTGSTQSNWTGTAVRAYTAGSDAFVAKFANTGDLSWFTFLGGAGSDYGNVIAIDSSDSLVVAGTSNGEWAEDPKNDWINKNDGFVAKIANNGTFGWYTFVGGAEDDAINGLTLDANKNIYIAGSSYATWGAPVNPYTSTITESLTNDGFVAKLSAGGSLAWNTFVGCAANDVLYCVSLDNNNNVFTAGYSQGTWGSPVKAYTPTATSSVTSDAAIVKLTNAGSLVWNTFEGSVKNERAYGVNPTANGIYVGGYAAASWANPVIPYTTGTEGFVARLTLAGALDSNVGTKTTQQTLKGVSVYPTAVTTEIMINGLESGMASIYDLNGREVLRVSINNTTKIDATVLSKGIYTIRLTCDNSSENFRIMKK